MTHYHVRLTEQGKSSDEVKNDIDQDMLETQFLAPYRTRRPITVNGKVIQPNKLERIRISASEETSDQIIQVLKYRDANSSVMYIGGPSMTWRAAAAAEDVTDQFITGPPDGDVLSTSATGTGTAASSGAISGPGDKRSVFIVAGRDTDAASGLIQVLRAMSLQIVEWEHAVAKTGLPNPYVGDVVTVGMRSADAAVVIITPDDLVKLRTDLLHDEDGDQEREIQGQPRPNVIYEAGFADALGRNRTLIVEIGSSKSFSDVSGRHTLHYDGTPAKRNALAERLRVAGLKPDTSGDHWLSVGDVGGAIAKANAAIKTERLLQSQPQPPKAGAGPLEPSAVAPAVPRFT